MVNFLAITLNVPSEVMEVAGQLGEPGFVGNLLVILIFLIIICIYGFLLDRHNMVINLLSLYVAFLVVSFFPYNVWQLGDWAESWWGHLLMLVGAAVLSAIVLSGTHLFKVVYASNFFVRWWQALVSGFLYGGLLTAIVLPALPAGFLNQFSPAFLDLFVSETASWLWLVLPLVGLLLIRHKKRGPGRPSY